MFWEKELEEIERKTLAALQVKRLNNTLRQAVTVLVNLPFADAVLSLAADGDAPPLTAERKDALRAAINLEGMPPGEYRWAMSFAPR